MTDSVLSAGRTGVEPGLWRPSIPNPLSSERGTLHPGASSVRYPPKGAAPWLLRRWVETVATAAFGTRNGHTGPIPEAGCTCRSTLLLAAYWPVRGGSRGYSGFWFPAKRAPV